MDGRRAEARTPWVRPVRRDLVGREVSLRALSPLLEAARERRLDVRALTAGTGFTVEQLTSSRERVSWTAFATFLTNAAKVLEDQDFIAIGDRALDSPVFRALLLPGRLLLDPVGIYMWALGPTGPSSQLFAAHDASISEVAPGQLRLVYRMKPGYAACHQNHLLLHGSLTAMARALGMPDADVVRTELPDGADFDVRVPARRGMLGSVMRKATWLFAARANARQLEQTNSELLLEIEARLHAEAALRRTNEELEQRVAERTASLEAANADLAAANADLESFSYTVSHDLRAPLRVLDGFSQVLADEVSDRLSDSERGHLERIRAGAKRMSDLLDALLELSRLARTELQHDSLDLAALATLILEELAATDPARVVSVHVASPIPAFGDRRLLYLVMQNLIGNAWKFTRRTDGARIEIGVRNEGDAAVYFVRDNGVGFAMEHADRLFTPFARLHAGSDFPGSGIGLATVRRIIARHRGRIWADAREGSGATFSFTLPIRAHP